MIPSASPPERSGRTAPPAAGRPARRAAVAASWLAAWCLAAGAPAGAAARWPDAGAPLRVAAPPVARGGARDAPAPIARLRIESGDGESLAWVQNPLDGPIEVLLRAHRGAVPQAAPALPARATVPARTEVLVSRIAGHGPPAELALTAVPGHPNARPRDIEYGYPLETGAVRVEQGWGGGFSHTDAQNRHAVDFAAPVGTGVLAARDGVVMQAEAGFAEGAGDDDGAAASRANFVRILHDDGTMALYAHLETGGVLVRPGQRVRRGERIARSGNTGLSSGPHLHFVVQVNRGLALESIPFRMFGPRGTLRFGEAPGPGPQATRTAR